MNLNDVHRGISRHKKRKRLGRGIGSGQGKTAGRGHKGAGSRAGYKRNIAFQGGAMPLVRRVPKRGFHNQFALRVVAVNVSDLEREFQAGDEVSPDTLRQRAILRTRYDVLKVLGDGELTKRLKVSAHRFSKSAREKIAAAGGEVIELPGKTSVEEKKQQKRAQAAG
jgi:large subunit ribosomal protein L15